MVAYPAPVGRMVTLVLVDPGGTVLGALPPYPVPSPWWQEAAEVVAGARAAYGREVTVLRLLHADGADVTYLAGTTEPVAGLAPAEIDDTVQPNRPRYAQPGGPEAGLAWARARLAERYPHVAAGDWVAGQVRTWNLSSIWVLDGPPGRVWLKEVPGFFAHEGPLLTWLAGRFPGLAPAPLAAGDGRVLLADIPGRDCYDAPATDRQAMLELMHQAQVGCLAATGELLALGVPDRRAAVLTGQLRDTVHRYGDPALATGAVLLDGLAGRLARLARCGIPDTLVHGDLHPGNVRTGPGGGFTVLDWGDAVLGHPGFDLLRMVERLDAPDAAELAARWCDRWRAACPGSAPDRALRLLEPLAALRNAATYAHFLDQIEPAEHGYHRADVPHWLSVAAARLAAEHADASLTTTD
jgi:hypothetical protein